MTLRPHLPSLKIGALLFGFFLVFSGICPASAGDRPFYSSFSASQGLDMKKWYVSNGWANGDHQSCEWRADAVSITDNRLVMRLSDKGGKLRRIGCPEIQSRTRMGYGRYEVRMRTAAGSGLNTAFFTFVGPPVGVPEHDEIDFEFLGKDPSTVEITHWTNGRKNPGIKIPLGYDSSKEFHNYAIVWTPKAIRWYVDNRLVHETPAGAAIPRNPPRIYLSLWSGSRIEDDWMGHFVYKAPVTAEVVWVKYTPAP
jgi:endo-1,3-1,4-beta-glycanase ExoK